MTQRWHVRRGTDVHGPFTTQECIEFRAEGRLQDHDEVRPDNATTWIRAGSVQLFQSQVDTMRMTPPPLPFSPQGVGQARAALPMRVLTNWLVFLIVASIGIELLAMIFMLEGISERSRSTLVTADEISALSLFPLLATVVVWMVWMYRGYANLERLGRPRNHGLGWVIGGWFVPFYNLYKPGAIGIDLEQQSASASGAPLTWAWARWWWGVYLVRAVLSTVAGMLSRRPALDLDVIFTLTCIDVGLAIGLCIAAIGFVQSVARKQEVAMSAGGSQGG